MLVKDVVRQHVCQHVSAVSQSQIFVSIVLSNHISQSFLRCDGVFTKETNISEQEERKKSMDKIKSTRKAMRERGVGKNDDRLTKQPKL